MKNVTSKNHQNRVSVLK